MQILEEESQLYFLANEWGSVGTMLQLLIFLLKGFATRQTFLHISQIRATVECLHCIHIHYCS